MEIGYTINNYGRKRILQFYKRVNKKVWLKIGEYKTYPYDVKGYLLKLRQGASLVLLGSVYDNTSDKQE
jgi:hypothetical protein